jgi:hypothetical protein
MIPCQLKQISMKGQELTLGVSLFACPRVYEFILWNIDFPRLQVMDITHSPTVVTIELKGYLQEADVKDYMKAGWMITPGTEA